MTVAVVRFEKAKHHEQVLALYAKVFGASAAQRFRARFSWSQECNPFPDATYRWVLTSGEQVLGFLGTIPQALQCGEQTLLVHSTADYMVDPDVRFHGLKLMREFFRTCDNSISMEDVPDTIGVLKWMKCVPVGEMQRYVKVLDPRVAARKMPVLAKIPDWAMFPARFSLGIIDTLYSVRLPKVVTLPGFDSRFDRLATRIGCRSAVHVKHDAAYLQWRYGELSPHHNPTIGGVLDERGELLGFVVANVTNSAEPTGYIYELELDSTDERIQQALLLFAIRELRKRKAWVVRYHRLANSVDLSEGLLESYRFTKRTAKHDILVRMRDECCFAVARDIQNWRYSYGDGEPSHSSTC